MGLGLCCFTGRVLLEEGDLLFDLELKLVLDLVQSLGGVGALEVLQDLRIVEPLALVLFGIFKVILQLLDDFVPRVFAEVVVEVKFEVVL